jgi:hypothetical protein
MNPSMYIITKPKVKPASAASGKTAKVMSDIPLCCLECCLSFQDEQNRRIVQSLKLNLRHNVESGEIEAYHSKGYLVGSFFEDGNKALTPLLIHDDVIMECKVTDPMFSIIVEIAIFCTEEAVSELLLYIDNLRANPDKNFSNWSHIKFTFVCKLNPDADTDTSGCESDSDTEIDDLIQQLISQTYQKVTASLTSSSNKKKPTPSKSAAAAAKKAAKAEAAQYNGGFDKPSYCASDRSQAKEEVAEMVQTRPEDQEEQWGRLICGVDTHVLGLTNHPGYVEVDEYMALIPDYPYGSGHNILWAVNGQGEVVGNLP